MDLTEVKTEAKRLLDADDLPHAVLYARLATDLDPRDAEAWFLYAECHARREDFDEAIRGYEQALNLQPDNALTCYGLGIAYWKKGSLDKAALYLVRARDADPSEPGYLADLGAVLVEHGRLDDGIALLEKSHLEKPESERCKYFLGFSYIRKAYQDWIEVEDGARFPPGMYARSPHLVRRAEELKAKAEALGSADPDLIKALEDLGNDIRRITSRRPRGLWWLGLIYVAGGLAWAFTNMPAGGSVVALGILFVISCLAPMHTYFLHSLDGEQNLVRELGKYFKLINADGNNINKQDNIYKHAGSIGDVALNYIETITIMPIAALWNFHKNYVEPGEKAAGLAMMGVTALALCGLVVFAGDAGRTGTAQSAATNASQGMQTPDPNAQGFAIDLDTPPSSVTKDGQTALARPEPEPARRDADADASIAKISGTGIKAADASSIELESGGNTILVKLSGIKPAPGQQSAEEREAAAFLTRLIKGQQISCQSKDKEVYLCTLDDSGEDIAEALILAGLAQPAVTKPSWNNNQLAVKLYALQAGNLASGDPEKTWMVIDPNCIFVDEDGGRLSAQEVRPSSQQFLASIRNARIKYKIYNVVLNDEKLIVHAQSELHFESPTEILFIQDWTPHIKTDMILQTWQKKGKVWRVVESRKLRPESIRPAEESSSQAPPPEKAIWIAPLSPCAKQCSDTATQCPAETNRSCAAEYRTCVANCKQ